MLIVTSEISYLVGLSIFISKVAFLFSFDFSSEPVMFEWMESTSFGIDIIGSVGSAENVIVDCWSFEGMEINADRKIIQATSTDMETIWQFVYDNWDDEVWNLSLSKNPTLKNNH